MDLNSENTIMYVTNTHKPMPKVKQREVKKIGRNELCPCGSGKKYKKCCDNPQVVQKRRETILHEMELKGVDPIPKNPSNEYLRGAKNALDGIEIDIESESPEFRTGFSEVTVDIEKE